MSKSVSHIHTAVCAKPSAVHTKPSVPRTKFKSLDTPTTAQIKDFAHRQVGGLIVSTTVSMQRHLKMVEEVMKTPSKMDPAKFEQIMRDLKKEGCNMNIIRQYLSFVHTPFERMDDEFQQVAACVLVGFHMMSEAKMYLDQARSTTYIGHSQQRRVQIATVQYEDLRIQCNTSANILLLFTHHLMLSASTGDKVTFRIEDDSIISSVQDLWPHAPLSPEAKAELFARIRTCVELYRTEHCPDGFDIKSAIACARITHVRSIKDAGAIPRARQVLAGDSADMMEELSQISLIASKYDDILLHNPNVVDVVERISTTRTMVSPGVPSAAAAASVDALPPATIVSDAAKATTDSINSALTEVFHGVVGVLSQMSVVKASFSTERASTTLEEVIPVLTDMITKSKSCIGLIKDL